jgi:hypothetical protein
MVIYARGVIDAWTACVEALHSRADHVKAVMVMDAGSSQVSVSLTGNVTQMGIYAQGNHVRWDWSVSTVPQKSGLETRIWLARWVIRHWVDSYVVGLVGKHKTTTLHALERFDHCGLIGNFRFATATKSTTPIGFFSSNIWNPKRLIFFYFTFCIFLTKIQLNHTQ